MTNCNKTEKNINFPMPAVHFLTDSAHQRHLLAASNVLQAHLQAMVLLQYFMVMSWEEVMCFNLAKIERKEMACFA